MKKKSVAKKCKDCNKLISQKAVRCRSCFHNGTKGRTPYNKGKRTTFVVCVDCGKKSYHNGKTWKRCRECNSQKMKEKPPSPNPIWLIPWGKKWHFGKRHSEETKIKMSCIKQGIEPVEWKGYTKTENQKIRYSIEYSLWRSSVFARDGYKCVICGGSGKIEADHIKPFAKYPNLRLAIDNGRTLCKKCHRQTDTWGFKQLWNKKK